MKTRGSLARDAHFGASNSQSGRSFSRFALQAPYFRVSISGCRFRVAGAALSAHAFCISWQVQHFVMRLENGESFAKVIFFHFCKNGFIRKTRRKSPFFTLKWCCEGVLW